MDGNLGQMMGGQMMAMASMKEGVSFWQIMFGFLMMQLMTILPHIKKFFEEMIKRYFDRKSKEFQRKSEELLGKLDKVKSIKSSIKFAKGEKNGDDTVINAINYHITNLNESQSLFYRKDYLVVNGEPFEIAPLIYCQVTVNPDSLTEEADEKIKFQMNIFSYELDLVQIKNFVEKTRRNYLYEQNNKLGNQKYYFDEKHHNLPKNHDGSIRFESAPGEMVFTMVPFHTNKSLSNVFGNHLKIVKERVDLFINHPEWYEEKGIPYTLGILLHGPPGTGKTSLIKAISRDTRRHIFNISLSPDTTQTQLRNLFFNEEIKVLGKGRTESFNIPLDERIYVIEDVDCLSDVVHDRKIDYEVPGSHEVGPNKKIGPTCSEESGSSSNSDFESAGSVKRKPEEEARQIKAKYTEPMKPIPPSNVPNGFSGFGSVSEMFGVMEGGPQQSGSGCGSEPSESAEKLTLSFLLNLFDGILETPGRIIIMTTNNPEILDKALIRPGRIDVNLRVGYCDLEMICQMWEFFFKEPLPKEKLDSISYQEDRTPAEVNGIFLNNINNPEVAFRALFGTQGKRNQFE